MSAAVKQIIARYFDQTIRFYRVFWHGRTGALHFGIRDRQARGHFAELENTNRVVAEQAEIKGGQRILDAGCGVGGSASWLVENYDVDVVGVTLSPLQAEHARHDADAHGLADRLAFSVCDYSDLGFRDGSFDVVWALESSCYAADKRAFLREAFRLLKPGGRLVVADGFTKRPPATRFERALYRAFHDGLLLPDLIDVQSFSDAIRAAGFREARVESRLRGVIPSTRRLFLRCLLSYPLAVLAYWIGRIPSNLLANSRAGMALYWLARMGLVDYAIVGATRPAQ